MKPKPKGQGSTFEETRPDHLINSAVTGTKPNYRYAASS